METSSMTMKRHRRQRSSSDEEQDTSSDSAPSNRAAYTRASSRHRSDDSRDQWEPPNIGGEPSTKRRVRPKATTSREPGLKRQTSASSLTDGPWPDELLTDQVPPTAQLKIVRQPEDKHRARYLSEGSRGAVKDSTRTSFVTIQLIGYSRPTNLQVYAGLPGDSGQPHPLYRVIKVQGKTGSHVQHTPCTEARTHDGTHCLNITMRPEHNMVAVLDCVGILKVCSTGGASVSRRRHQNSAAREKHSAVTLVLSAQVPDGSGGHRIVQTISSSIQCVQQLGHPEMFKVSTQRASVNGGQQLMIIGRNFDNSTSLLFREYKETGELVWSAEADLDKKLLGQCHMVATIPTYRQLNIPDVVEVSMTVKCGSKSSHPMTFQYHPADVQRGEQWTEWMPPSGSVIVKQSPTPMPPATPVVFEQQQQQQQPQIFTQQALAAPVQQQQPQPQQYQLLGTNQTYVSYDPQPSAPMLTTVQMTPASNETWTPAPAQSSPENVTSSTSFAPQISTTTTGYPQFQEGTPLIEYIHQHQQPTLPTVTTETLESGDVARTLFVDNEFEQTL